MKKYIFVFGRDPKLSYAELISYFKNFNIKYKLNYSKDKVAVFSLSNFDVDISKLGGTVKIAEVILEGGVKDSDFYLGSKNKINYVISVYNNKKFLGEFEECIVKWFKSQKIKALRKKPKEKDFSPKELRNVLEFIICDNYIGRTVLVSNPKEYKKRDRERPYNEFKRSMSIRLAKILINLARGKKGKLLLDPFCGVGVLLEECVIQGIKCVGVEIDENVRRKALKNLSFVSGEFKIIHGNSAKINKYFNKVDCVASEPYMGPFFKSYPKKDEVVKVVRELNKLYEEFFVNLKKVLKGKAAIEMPVFKASNRKRYRLNVESFLKKSGFKMVKLDDVKFPILYKDKKSIVEREIYVLE